MECQYENQTKLFKALAHPVRLQILEILSNEPACVCDLVQQTGCRQPYVSQQLIVLREAGLVATRREGLNIRYRLTCPDLLVSLLRDGAILLGAVGYPWPDDTIPGE